MHRHDTSTEVLTQAIVRYAIERVRLDPPPLDGPRTYDELFAMAGQTITERGIGGLEALRIFGDVLAPACISIDHPQFLSFVPAAPTEAAILFDLVVGASSIYGGSWLEGGGAIYAENQALRWIADLAGLPAEAGGVFVSGGTAGNLSALIAARWRWRRRADGNYNRTRGMIVTSSGAHSSVMQAATAMDADMVVVDDSGVASGSESTSTPDGGPNGVGRLTGGDLRRALDALPGTERQRVFAIVATAGTTNAGVVDDLAGIADAAEQHGIWFHVDGAYGLAALAAPSVRARFVGVERADSLIVDPHKWLFAPFDSCALLYRDPPVARAAHTQQAEYLDVLHPEQPSSASVSIGADIARDAPAMSTSTADVASSADPIARDEGPVVAALGPHDPHAWNASDYAHHLSRRARGLPLWFSLATHGTAAYAEAIETTLAVAGEAARMIDTADHVELLLEPELSIVMFRRVGWQPDDYITWSDRMLREQQAFVTPTKWHGETVLRICVVNPLTTADDIAVVLDSLR